MRKSRRHTISSTEPMSLPDAYRFLRTLGRAVRPCEVARLIGARDGESALLRFETARLLLQQEGDDGLVRPIQLPE